MHCRCSQEQPFSLGVGKCGLGTSVVAREQQTQGSALHPDLKREPCSRHVADTAAARGLDPRLGGDDCPAQPSTVLVGDGATCSSPPWRGGWNLHPEFLDLCFVFLIGVFRSSTGAEGCLSCVDGAATRDISCAFQHPTQQFCSVLALRLEIDTAHVDILASIPFIVLLYCCNCFIHSFHRSLPRLLVQRFVSPIIRCSCHKQQPCY